MTENVKLQELFKCTKHTQLTRSVKALEVRYDMDGLTYTQAANHLTAAVSKLPDYQMAHCVSNIKTAGGEATSKDVFVMTGTQSMQLTARSGLGTTMNGPQ